MQSLSVLLWQFFFSFFAGCIINAYVIIYYLVLKNVGIFSAFPILDKTISVFLNKMDFTFTFIVVAIALGIIIEGVFQICIEQYYFKTDKSKIFKDQNREKHTIKGRFLKFFVAESTIMYVCKHLFDKKEYLIDTFIEDSGRGNTSSQDLYDAVQGCARVIEKNGINVYRFRDVSFIMQLTRVSFFFILGASILSSIVFSIILCGTEYFYSYLTFIILSIIISLFFICIIPIMSRAVGRRYISEVGISYNAIRFVLPSRK